MNATLKMSLQYASASVLAVCVLSANDKMPQIMTGALTSQAIAWIGRPLTPMSYAGVARRTTRRAYAYGAGAQTPQPSGGIAASATVTILRATRWTLFCSSGLSRCVLLPPRRASTNIP